MPKTAAPGTWLGGVKAWILHRRAPLLFGVLLAALLPAHDLWAPDEPDFAQIVREMQERGSWSLPYLNGLPYSEKPILFFWLLRLCSEAVLGIAGHGGEAGAIIPWALRLPSVLAAAGFAFAFRGWARRFLGPDRHEVPCAILFSTPIWVWQAHTIQIDMVFASLLAWSWLSWLGGWLLETGTATPSSGARAWFISAYLSLGLATLAKGPLALVLSALVLAAFLLGQRSPRGFLRAHFGWGTLLVLLVVLPWYAWIGWTAGSAFLHELVIHQNIVRATRAWDHIQPWWRYLGYLAGDFFPWVLLLPPVLLGSWRRRRELGAPERFFLAAFLVPLVLLSLSQSKQGKYLLMAYPFLALLIPEGLEPESTSAMPWVARWVRPALLGSLWLLTGLLFGLAWLEFGGPTLRTQLAPFLPLLRILSLLAAGCALLAGSPILRNPPSRLIRATALALATQFLVAGAWGFRILDETKSYHRWTEAVRPLIQGRKVYFWQTLRSGAMVYTGQRMPELRTLAELERTLGPEDRLVSQKREWDQDAWGMTPEARGRFEVLLRVPTGGSELLLLRRVPSAPPAPPPATTDPAGPP